MIASWMLYALAISILTTIAGIGATRAFEVRGWPTRFVWAAALAVSVLWPIGAEVLRRVPARAAAVAVLPFTIIVEAPAVVVSAGVDRAISIDRALIAIWLVLSLGCLGRIASAVRLVERSRRRWKKQHIDGMRVQISENVGPAVVGLGTMDVVLPAWILSLDAPLRALVLRHEEEHRLARDPYLLFGAAVIVALMPWNLALWYHVRRLRLAVELDCDRRVLRVHPTPERYGMLMLTIAQRRSVAPAMFAPMLTEPTSNLERRIMAMRSTTKRLARVTAYGGGLVAAAMLLLASSLQSAPRNFAKPTISNALTRAVAAVGHPALKEMYDESYGARARRDTATVRRLPPVSVLGPRGLAEARETNPAPRYPDMLRSAGIEGGVVARYTTTSQGVPDSASIEILESSHQLFTNAVLRVLPLWHMAPNTTIETPFTFAMPSSVEPGQNGGQPTFHGRMVGGVLIISGIPSPRAVQMKQMGGVPTAPIEPTIGQQRKVEPTQFDPAADKRAADGGQVYFEFQTERQVTPLPGSPAPRYPDMLRKAEVEGMVLAQFVVDTTGHPLMETFKVLKSDHELFTQAVMLALPGMNFTPAEIGGMKVRQVVQMPLQFSLNKSEKP